MVNFVVNEERPPLNNKLVTHFELTEFWLSSVDILIDLTSDLTPI